MVPDDNVHLSKNDEIVGGFLSSGGLADLRNDDLAYGGQRGGVPPDGLCDGGRVALVDQRIRSETTGHHISASDLPANI